MPDDAGAVRRAYEAAAGDYARIHDDELADDPGAVAIVRGALGALPPGSPVVDVGCGPAQLSPLLADLGLVPIGLDLTAAMLREGRARHPAPCGWRRPTCSTCRSPTARARPWWRVRAASGGY